MAKNEVTAWSPTRALNLDVGGIGIASTDTAGNISPAFQEIMAQIADVNDGTTPLDDTFAIRNVSDTTKVISFSAANVTTGTSIEIDANSVYRYGAPTQTIYVASGTHTFASTTRFFVVEAVGAGGGGGGVDGQGAGKMAAASGGGSGYFGKTPVLTKGAIATGTIVIGAGGAGGSGGGGGSTGANGGSTTWDDGTNSLSFGGGRGGIGATADSGGAGIAFSPDTAFFIGNVLLGGTHHNTMGSVRNGPSGAPTTGDARGGVGGFSPYGRCAIQSTEGAGVDATGYGAGGGGASVVDLSTNYNGGAGGNGLLIVWEW